MRLVLLIFLFLVVSQPHAGLSSHFAIWRPAILSQPEVQHESDIQQQSDSHHQSNDSRGWRLKTEIHEQLGQSQWDTMDFALPMPQGHQLAVTLIADSIFQPQLQRKFPSIKSFRILNQSGRFIGRGSFDETGFMAFVQVEDKWVSVRVSSDPEQPGEVIYHSRQISDIHHGERGFCTQNERQPHIDSHDVYKHKGFPPWLHHVNATNTYHKQPLPIGDELSVYRFAVTTNGQYYQSNGGTDEAVMAAINRKVNLVNAVLRFDLAIKLIIVDNNERLLYDDPETDPFNGDQTQDIYTNQVIVDDLIGDENYDIGHLFSLRGGYAGINILCKTGRKARAISQVFDNESLRPLIHELGHQFGSRHSHSGTSIRNLCWDTRGDAIELGGGGSIMSYGCSADSAPQFSRFHIGTIKKILNARSLVDHPVCGAREVIDNSPPNVEAGTDFIIPANTPFKLTGTASDADGDTLQYNWDHLEYSGGFTTPLTMREDDSSRILFQSKEPSEQPFRYFPAYDDVIGNVSNAGETLATTARNLNMVFSARDSQGGVASDTMTVRTVETHTGFALLAPNNGQTIYQHEKLHLRWHTGNSHLPPINCQTVDSYISNDNGKTFESFIFGLENDGSHIVSHTLAASEQYRFKLTCPGSIFYAVSPHSTVVSGDVSPLVDDDNDGMPNAFEIRFGFNIANANDAGFDNDRDGLTNLEEFYIQSNPLRDDSDRDGTLDGHELLLGTSPNDILSRIGEFKETAFEDFEEDNFVFNFNHQEEHITDSNAYEGERSLAVTSDSALKLSLDNPQLGTTSLEFYLKLSPGGSALIAHNGDELSRLSRHYDWVKLHYSIPSGEHEISISSLSGTLNTFIDNVYFGGDIVYSRPPFRQEINVDFSEELSAEWTLDSNGEWALDSAFGAGDNYSFSASNAVPFQRHFLNYDVNVEQITTLKFDYFVEGTQKKDFLRFYMNGTRQSIFDAVIPEDATSGEMNGWQTYTTVLDKGTNQLSWTHYHNHNTGEESTPGRVWLDNVRFTVNLPSKAIGKPLDTNGDGKEELILRRAESFQFFRYNDDTSSEAILLGRDASDIPVTGDFDGDGYADYAVRRASTGFWYILNSSGLDILTGNSDAVTRYRFGVNADDIPVPADYDGDGITDLAVRRPDNQTWYILNSSGVDSLSHHADGITRFRFGLNSEDIPVPADYDGDGKADLAVRRPSTQFWYIRNSSGVDDITQHPDGISRLRFGLQAEDIPVPADYDGDGKADLAVRRPSSQFWYIRNSSGFDPLSDYSDGISRKRFGLQAADIPVPADYDGDGKTDLAVRRASSQFWYIFNSSGLDVLTNNDDAISRIQQGRETDIPLGMPVVLRMAMVVEDEPSL